MKNTLLFDFLVNKDNNTMTVKREFAAGRQLVWDCHTKGELLEQWFAPKPFTAKTKSMDFKEGGTWLYAMVSPEGQEFWAKAEYRKINPIDSYSLQDAFCDENGVLNTELPRANWDVTFSEQGKDHTMVQTIVTYPSLADLEKVIEMGMKEGLTMTLENLDELLDKLKK